MAGQERERGKEREQRGSLHYFSVSIPKDEFVRNRSRSREEVGAFRFEQRDEFGLHVLVVVRNVEDGDLFAAESVAELAIQAFAVDRFHDHDEVGPFQLFLAEGNEGVVIEAGGVDFDARVVRKDSFRRWAAEFVLRAEAENVFQGFK